MNGEQRLNGSKKGNEVQRLKARRAYQDIEEKVTNWITKGLSLREIADRLNEGGFKTRLGKKFDPKTVSRIYNRMSQDVTVVSQDVTKVSEQVDIEVEILRSKIRGLEKGVSELHEEREELKTENAELKAERDKANESLAEFVKSNAELGKLVSELQIELETSKSAVIAPNNDALRGKLEAVLKPFQELIANNPNPNQPRLKKMVELLKAIEGIL